jgi:hypothetical protein
MGAYYSSQPSLESAKTHEILQWKEELKLKHVTPPERSILFNPYVQRWRLISELHAFSKGVSCGLDTPVDHFSGVPTWAKIWWVREFGLGSSMEQSP